MYIGGEWGTFCIVTNIISGIMGIPTSLTDTVYNPGQSRLEHVIFYKRFKG